MTLGQKDVHEEPASSALERYIYGQQHEHLLINIVGSAKKEKAI